MSETLPQAISPWRHPRRWGFIVFNIVALMALVSWIVASQNDLQTLGVFGLPYYALGYVGMAFLTGAWVSAWIAWIWMVVKRRRLRA